jgi:hypothetical protein
MLRVSFTAARRLTGTHAVGDTVALDMGTTEISPAGRTYSKAVQESKSGKRETLGYYSRRTWTATVLAVTPEIRAAVEEFLDSVAYGEAFTVQPLYQSTGPSLALDFVAGTFGAAEEVQAILEAESFEWAPLARYGGGAYDDVYTLQFRFSEA